MAARGARRAERELMSNWRVAWNCRERSTNAGEPSALRPFRLCLWSFLTRRERVRRQLGASLPHCRRIPRFMLTAYLSGTLSRLLLFSSNQKEKYRDENCDYSGCNACRGDCRWRGRPPAPTARLSAGSTRQDADWQGPNREDPNRQGARRDADLLIRGIDSGLVESDLYRRQLKGEAWQIGRRD